MQRKLISILTTLVAAFLVGCAGTNFARPNPSSLTLGKSTTQDVVAQMGEPRQTSEGLKNEKKVRSLTYAYAASMGTAKYPGVTPARAMTFMTHENVIVGQIFISSFSDDATDFDNTKIQQILKGKSTKSEVIQLLGKPNGEAIYPMIKNADETASIYSYSHTRTSPFSVKFYKQELVVSFDRNDVVSDIEYMSNGEK